MLLLGTRAHYALPPAILTWVKNSENTPDEGFILKQIEET